MIVTTGNEVSGRTITQYVGVVRGVVVRSTSLVSGIAGGLRSLFGGNITEYVAVCEEARRDAFERMVDHAKLAKADAIIGMRYDATEFVAGATEVLAYGTAVKLSP